MRDDGWGRDQVLELPYVELGYWYPQATRFQQLLGSKAAEPILQDGKRILDVGSNTCWASAMFAERGPRVVALDIASHELQGLKTADWWFDGKGVYFDRVLGAMFDPVFADDSFDAIFCSEVLHHNHRDNLRRTMREFHRILKPGGQVFVINEPVRSLRSPKFRPGRGEVAEYMGHEHVYMRSAYVRAASKAGLDVELVAPPSIGALNQSAWSIDIKTPTRLVFQMALGHAVRRSRRLRRAYLAWRTYVDGVSLYMIATKPEQASGRRSELVVG